MRSTQRKARGPCHPPGVDHGDLKGAYTEYLSRSQSTNLLRIQLPTKCAHRVLLIRRTTWSRTRNEDQKNPLTERSSAGYRPCDGLIFGWICVCISVGAHGEEFFPRYNVRFKNLAGLLPKENGLIKLGFPCQLHVLALRVKSDRASQAAVMMNCEGEHRARIPRWRRYAPGLRRKGGRALPPAESPPSS